MSEGQWWGVVIAGIGLYLFICATWKRDFFLYRLKVARAVRWYGESTTHIMYQVLGIVAIGAGVVKVLGYF